MQAHQAMPKFRCKDPCQHKGCNVQCLCLSNVNATSLFVENILDMSSTLAQIMVICGIHECKARAAIDIIAYNFMNYEEVCYCKNQTPKKLLRKEQMMQDLISKTLMNHEEASIAYNIIKRGFKAFYYRPDKENIQPAKNARTTFSEECAYIYAADRTLESFVRNREISCADQKVLETRIKVAYRKFYERMKERNQQPVGDHCNCCICAERRGVTVQMTEATKLLTSSKTKSKKQQMGRICPACCRVKRKMIHPQRKVKKCAVCHQPLKCCICPKCPIEFDWVKSIWHRPDMNIYYQTHIEKPREKIEGGCFKAPGAVSPSPSGEWYGSEPVTPVSSYMESMLDENDLRTMVPPMPSFMQPSIYRSSKIGALPTASMLNERRISYTHRVSVLTEILSMEKPTEKQ